MTVDEDRAKRMADLLGARVKVIMRDLLEFYEPSEAMLWFTSPHSLLEQDVPFLLLQTAGGYRRIKFMLARLKDGAYI